MWSIGLAVDCGFKAQFSQEVKLNSLLYWKTESPNFIKEYFKEWPNWKYLLVQQWSND